MSIQSQIERITANIQSALSIIQTAGISVPSGSNSDGLPGLVNTLANGDIDCGTFSDADTGTIDAGTF